jgi:hypothetical protein
LAAGTDGQIPQVAEQDNSFVVILLLLGGDERVDLTPSRLFAPGKRVKADFPPRSFLPLAAGFLSGCAFGLLTVPLFGLIFGGGEQLKAGDGEWSEKIRDLLAEPQHPNLYADISYFAADGLPDVLDRLLREHPALADRLMFGSDYIMIMLDRGLGGLQPYFDRFAGLDDRLLHDNAARFLRMP